MKDKPAVLGRRRIHSSAPSAGGCRLSTGGQGLEGPSTGAPEELGHERKVGRANVEGTGLQPDQGRRDGRAESTCSESRKESRGPWPHPMGTGRQSGVQAAHWLLGEAGLSPHVPSTLGPLLRQPDLPAHRGTAAAGQPSPTLPSCASIPATCALEHTPLEHTPQAQPRRGC